MQSEIIPFEKEIQTKTSIIQDQSAEFSLPLIILIFGV
jgi:hypothetical protein